MATVKVTALTETTSPQATDVLLISQSGVSKKVQITNLPAGTPGTGSISTAMLADDAVTEAKLANAINTAIAANTAKTSNATHTGDVTGATALTIGNDKVLTAMILDSNVTTAKIADDAVTEDKLANAINTTIAANTAKTGITSGQASAITANTAKVTNATHTGDVTGATALTIGNDKVVTAMILDDNVTADKLANSINTDIATGVTANTTANAALPKAGGTITGTVTVSANAVGTVTTDNDGSFAMSATNNFKCTPAGDFALTFTSIVAQSGNILLVNSGGHTISAHANTKVDANLLATISTAGTYLLSYFSDGTNVYMTNSAVYT